ncbi:MAG: hypothetical protein EHM61_20265 [Acidobacteria bacterium]|nr:MAG: hypothetical protein EHM61_20265 [Acidobacteriota bacterium]
MLAVNRFTLWKSTAGEAFRTRWACFLLLLLTILGFHWQLVIGTARVPFDFEGYHYPLLYQIFRNLQHGTLPLWDNSSYSGMPFVHNVNAATYYPVHLAVLGTFALLGLDFTLRLMQLLACFHYWLAAVGMFLLLEELRFRRSTAFLGGVLFACNGFLLAQSQHLGLVETVAWMPFAFLLLKKGIESGAWIHFQLLALVLAIMLFVGFLPEFLGFLIILVFFASWLILTRARSRLKATLQFAVSGLSALGLSAIVLLPVLEYAGYSLELDKHGGIPRVPLITALIPDYFGSSSLEKYWGSIDPTVNYFYAGLLVLIFLPLGLVTRRKELRFFQILLPVSFLLVFSPTADYFRQPLQALPLIGSLFRPVDLMIYVPLSAIILALAGLEAAKSSRPIALASAGWLLVVLALSYHALWEYRRSVLDEAAVPILLLFVVGVLAFALPKHWKTAVLPVLVVEVLLLNSGRFFAAFPGDPNSIGRNFVDSTNQGLIEQFQSDPDVFRISVDQEHMGGPWNSAFRVWGLESINGFDPLVNKHYLDFLQKNGLTWRTNRTFHLGDFDAPAFRFLNAKYYLTTQEMTPTHPDFEKVVDGWYRVYRYRKFTPRFLALSGIGGESISLDQLAASRPARVLEYKTNSRRLEVESAGGSSFLFVGEINYTGWRAKIDGQEARVSPVNGIFMGLPLPAGKHVVELYFSPWSFRWGLGISLLTLAVLLVSLVLPRGRHVASETGV